MQVVVGSVSCKLLHILFFHYITSYGVTFYRWSAEYLVACHLKPTIEPLPWAHPAGPGRAATGTTTPPRGGLILATGPRQLVPCLKLVGSSSEQGARRVRSGTNVARLSWAIEWSDGFIESRGHAWSVAFVWA